MPKDDKTEPMKQMSVGKWKRTNIPSYAPLSGGGLPDSFIGKTRTPYNMIGLMVTIYSRDAGSAAGRWVATSPVNKCRSLGYGAVHTRQGACDHTLPSRIKFSFKCEMLH